MDGLGYVHAYHCVRAGNEAKIIRIANFQDLVKSTIIGETPEQCL